MMSSLCKSIFKNQFDVIRNDRNIFQNRVLQMLFDVKFLLKLFCSNSTSKETVKIFIIFFHYPFVHSLSESIFTRRRSGCRIFLQHFGITYVIKLLKYVIKICYKDLLQTFIKSVIKTSSFKVNNKNTRTTSVLHFI